MLLRLENMNKVLSYASSVVKLTLYRTRSIFTSGVPLSAGQGKERELAEGRQGTSKAERRRNVSGCREEYSIAGGK